MGINNKLAPPWRCPFETIKMSSSVTAKIQEPGKKKLMVIHVNNLKKLIGAPNLPTSHDDEDDPEEDESEPEDANDDDDEDEPIHPQSIAKDEIIPDADLEAEKNKYQRHTRSRGPAPELPLVHKNLLEQKRNVGFQNEIHVIG